MITDRRIAMLQLNDCRHAVDEAAGQDNTKPRIHGNAAERSTRQTVLTLKNNIIRDNVAVMAYSGIKYGIDAKKEKGVAGPQRQMDIEGERYTISEASGPDQEYAGLSTRPEASGNGPVAAKARDWAPPLVELGLHGDFLGYYGGNGGAVGYLFTDNADAGNVLLLVLGNSLHDGWSLGGTVTVTPGSISPTNSASTTASPISTWASLF